jgi:uncharacterized repeat protein (TIGR01451 family)
VKATHHFSILLAIVICLLVPAHAPGAVSVDHSSSTATLLLPASSLTWSHTVSSNLSGMLIVGVSIHNTTDAVTSVTYHGLNLTPLGIVQNANHVRVEMWYLKAPPTGTHDVVVTLSGSVLGVVAGAASYTGVNQTDPFYGTFASSTGTSTQAAVTVATHSANQLVMDTVAIENLTLLAIPGGGQTVLWGQALDLGLNAIDGAASWKQNGGSVTTSWSWLLVAQPWAIGAVVLNDAPPDAMIRNSGEADTSYITATLYETAASAQAKAQTTVNGTTATYDLKFANDGASAMGVIITGTASGSGFTVKYRDGSDVTGNVTGAGHTISIPGGGSVVMTLEVTPGSTVIGGTSYPVLVTATLVGDSTRVDQVKATTTSASPVLTLMKSADKGSCTPGEEITYTVTASNGPSLSSASAIVITDPVPADTGFKLGGAGFDPLATTLTATYSYSQDGTTYDYTPASGGCSAPAGYDHCVRKVKWTMNGSMPAGSSFKVTLVVRVK